MNAQKRQLIPLRRIGALLALAVIALAGCTPKLIGDYDDTFDQGVTAVEQKTELYLAKLKSNPNTPFDQGFYDDITSSLAVLKTRAAALPQYEILGQQVANLQQQMDDFQKLDKASPVPSPLPSSPMRKATWKSPSRAS